MSNSTTDLVLREAELQRMLNQAISYLGAVRQQAYSSAAVREKGLSEVEKLIPYIKRSLWVIKNIEGSKDVGGT